LDRWLTFDCFGTLIDWRHGIRTTGELLFPGRGEEFLDAYIALEAEVEAEGSFKRYRAVLTETARRAAKQLDLDLKPDDATALVSTIPH
jgi:2-haloacid dehalogenase